MKNMIKSRVIHLLNAINDEESETNIILKHKGRRSFQNLKTGLNSSYYQLLTNDNTPLYECAINPKNGIPLHIFSIYAKEDVGVIIDTYGTKLIVNDPEGKNVTDLNQIVDIIMAGYLLEIDIWKKRSLKK